MLEGSKPSRIVPHLEVLASNLTDEQVTTSESLRLKRALAEAIAALADALRDQGKGGAVEAHFRETGRLKSMEPMFAGLLRSLLQLKRSPELHAIVSSGVRSLAAAEGMGKLSSKGKNNSIGGGDELEANTAVERLFDAHFEPLLLTAIEDFPFSGLWTAQCAEQLVIDELLGHIRGQQQNEDAGPGSADEAQTHQHLHSVCAFMSDVASADFSQANEAARLHNANLLLELLRRPSLADVWRTGSTVADEQGHISTVLNGCILLPCWGESSKLAGVRLSMVETVILGANASKALITPEDMSAQIPALSKIVEAHLDGHAVVNETAVNADDGAATAVMDGDRDGVTCIGSGQAQRLVAMQLCIPLLEMVKSDPENTGAARMPSAVKPIYHALLRRLDDSSDSVRMATIDALEPLVRMLPVGTEEVTPEVIEVPDSGASVDLDAQPAEPEYSHFLQTCLVQLRVGEEAESREFKDGMVYFMQMAATVDPVAFIKATKQQNSHYRTNAYEDLIDHAELILSLKGEGKGKP